MFLVSLFNFHFYITVSKIRLSPIFLDFPTFTFPFSYFPLSCPIFLNIWGGACATVSLMFLVSGTWPSSDNLTAQTYTYTCTLNTFTHLCTMYVYLYFTYTYNYTCTLNNLTHTCTIYVYLYLHLYFKYFKLFAVLHFCNSTVLILILIQYTCTLNTLNYLLYFISAILYLHAEERYSASRSLYLYLYLYFKYRCKYKYDLFILTPVL